MRPSWPFNPRAAAPPSVAAAKTSDGLGQAAKSPPSCRGRLIARRMPAKWSARPPVLAASLPSASRKPQAVHARKRITPLPSIKLVAGLWLTVTSWRQGFHLRLAQPDGVGAGKRALQQTLALHLPHQPTGPARIERGLCSGFQQMGMHRDAMPIPQPAHSAQACGEQRCGALGELDADAA